MLIKFSFKSSFIFPEFSRFTLFINDLASIFNVLFAIYFPLKFTSLSVVIFILFEDRISPLFLILEVLILVSTDFNFPLLSKDFPIVIFLAWIKLEFFISSVLIFFPTWIFLEFVISFVVKFSLTFISPPLFKLFTSILLLSILFEFIKLLAFKFSFTKIFFKLLILLEDKLLLIISPEFINSWAVIIFEEISPLLDISFVNILSLRIFPLEFILFFISKVFPWTVTVLVKFWEFIMFLTNNFPLFVITPEFTLFITVILPLLSKLLLFKFLEIISELLVLFTTLLELIFSFTLILFEFSKLVVVKFSLETSPKLFKLFVLIFFWK